VGDSVEVGCVVESTENAIEDDAFRGEGSEACVDCEGVAKEGGSRAWARFALSCSERL
jgi:hypothetical protein